ncbi:hypothetical protein BKA66DRAFT_168373 [Pyrenochaeta sp. MPI-SDFR-AT-0127]|nr:hypothetical protein BKA66DRAFT_168373 [Pyrenochaeta sp. MPI-SDFR-AT-0127]
MANRMRLAGWPWLFFLPLCPFTHHSPGSLRRPASEPHVAHTPVIVAGVTHYGNVPVAGTTKTLTCRRATMIAASLPTPRVDCLHAGYSSQLHGVSVSSPRRHALAIVRSQQAVQHQSISKSSAGATVIVGLNSIGPRRNRQPPSSTSSYSRLWSFGMDA